MDVFAGLLTFVRDGAAYGFLIYRILEEGMSAADFVFYFGMISQYSATNPGLRAAINAEYATSPIRLDTMFTSWRNSC